jgi:VanZ family protein
LPQDNFSTRAVAWIACTVLALLIETGKLFFAGRAPNCDSALLDALGALCGVSLGPRLAAGRMVRRNSRQIMIALMLCLVVYSELSPFDWRGSLEEAVANMTAIEWLPFASYYGADPQLALFDLLKKFFLLVPLGFLIAAGNPAQGLRNRRQWAAATGLMLGLILEFCQIFLKSRTPSITDVFLFAATAYAGAVIFERYWQIKNATA